MSSCNKIAGTESSTIVKKKKVKVNKCKLKNCRRCDMPFFEIPENETRRIFLGAAVICPDCEDEFELVKVKKGLSPLQYIGYTEPFMW